MRLKLFRGDCQHPFPLSFPNQILRVRTRIVAGHDIVRTHGFVRDKDPVDILLRLRQFQLPVAFLLLGDSHDHKTARILPVHRLIHALVVFVTLVPVSGLLEKRRITALVAERVANSLVFTGFYTLSADESSISMRPDILHALGQQFAKLTRPPPRSSSPGRDAAYRTGIPWSRPRSTTPVADPSCHDASYCALCALPRCPHRPC